MSYDTFMKVVNNSDIFPAMSNLELIQELCDLDVSLKLAEQLGTGTAGIVSIIDAAEKELVNRGVDEAQITNRRLHS